MNFLQISFLHNRNPSFLARVSSGTQWLPENIQMAIQKEAVSPSSEPTDLKVIYCTVLSNCFHSVLSSFWLLDDKFQWIWMQLFWFPKHAKAIPLHSPYEKPYVRNKYGEFRYKTKYRFHQCRCRVCNLTARTEERLRKVKFFLDRDVLNLNF